MTWSWWELRLYSIPRWYLRRRALPMCPWLRQLRRSLAFPPPPSAKRFFEDFRVQSGFLEFIFISPEFAVDKKRHWSGCKGILGPLTYFTASCLLKGPQKVHQNRWVKPKKVSRLHPINSSTRNKDLWATSPLLIVLLGLRLVTN